MRKYFLAMGFFILVVLPLSARADIDQFKIRSVSNSDFRDFVKIFSEMRGPLRVEILKDKNTNFENADPLKYVTKIKDEKDVLKMLDDRKLTWDSFTELMGNVLLGYFNIQPDKTKAALMRQLADYGLGIADIPPEYRSAIDEVLKTDQVAAGLASMALEYVVKIPPENVALAKKNKRTLDQLFYTRFWKDKL